MEAQAAEIQALRAEVELRGVVGITISRGELSKIVSKMSAAGAAASGGSRF